MGNLYLIAKSQVLLQIIFDSECFQRVNDTPVCNGDVSWLLLLIGALTQAIRNFAKSLESWLTNAMMNIPEEMVRIKVRTLVLL